MSIDISINYSHICVFLFLPQIYFVWFICLQMEKRKHIEVQTFGNSPSGYLLLYFGDGGYEIIHSSSTLIPSNLRYETIEEKTDIILRHGLHAKVLIKSESEKDIQVFQRRLMNKLDVETVPLDSSFRFLDDSLADPQKTIDDSSSDETVVENLSASLELDVPEESGTMSLVLCELKIIASLLSCQHQKGSN